MEKRIIAHTLPVSCTWCKSLCVGHGPSCSRGFRVSRNRQSVRKGSFKPRPYHISLENTSGLCRGYTITKIEYK